MSKLCENGNWLYKERENKAAVFELVMSFLPLTEALIQCPRERGRRTECVQGRGGLSFMRFTRKQNEFIYWSNQVLGTHTGYIFWNVAITHFTAQK